MWGFLGKLFGTDKAAESLINNVSSGIDKMFYTSQEQVEDAAKARTEGFAVYMKWLESTTGSRIARRIIALTVVGIWAIEHLTSVVMGQVAIFIDHPEHFLQAAEQLSTRANENNSLVGVVLLFYFGGPVATEGVKSLVNKWVNRGK